MKLADKIIKLRKEMGWSQEELAEKMDVSRQSVSKWEGALSIPDINKIIRLGEIFGVSTDYLIKDEIEEASPIESKSDDFQTRISLDDAYAFADIEYKKSRVISWSVFIMISSIIPLLSLLAISGGQDSIMPKNLATAIGFIVFFVLISLSISLIIRVSHKEKIVEIIESTNFELEYGSEGIFRDKLEEYRPKYNRVLSTSIMLFIVCPLPLIVSSILGASSFIILMMCCLLLLLIAIGVLILIPTSSLYESYRKLLHEGQYSKDNAESNKRVMLIAGIYWPTVVAIYIGWSLWTMAWGTTWIIWPVAAVLFAAVIGISNMISQRN